MKIVSLTPEEEAAVAKMRREALKAKAGEASREVVRAEDNEVVFCRATSFESPVLAAAKDWAVGEKTEFMFMPAGVHTICAGFRKGSIELTVKCDESTAQAAQASLDGWRAERPKQECYGCVEHREAEASVRVSASCGFSWRGDGVYLAAEPTKLGVENVNGRIHRSWSPSFTTDADYSKAKDQGGMLVFPEGVRGSRSNPAEITGIDFVLGTITNKPAFREMSPVKARESGDVVAAEGTSEGVRKAWETRRTGSGKDIPHISDEVYTKAEREPKWSAAVSPLHDRDVGGRQLKRRLQGWSKKDHEEASAHHMAAAKDHEQAWGEKQKEAHNAAFGKDPEFHDYRVSGIGRDEYSEEHKDALRNHAHSKTAHISAARAHWKAAGHHGVITEDLKAKVNSADPTLPDSVRAHCRATLLQDVPDATEAEVAQYEAEVEGGGSHSDAVIKLRSARQNGFKTTGSEKPTLDTIAAKHTSALEAANRIAAEHGAAKLTAEDVYERFAPAEEDATPEAILERIYARAGGNR